jgi:hypothetical protein
MNARHRLVPLVFITLSVLRCGEAPTEPFRIDPTPSPTAFPTPGPTPPPLDLNGEWSGTFKGGSCGTPEPVRMTIHHDGDRIQAYFEMSCFSTNGYGTRHVELSNRSSGYFWLYVNDQGACLLSGGQLSSTRIHLFSRSSNMCVGAELTLTR